MGLDAKGGEVRLGHGTRSGEIRIIRVDKLIFNAKPERCPRQMLRVINVVHNKSVVTL